MLPSRDKINPHPIRERRIKNEMDGSCSENEGLPLALSNSKVLSLEKPQINLAFCALIRTFVPKFVKT